MLFNSIEFLVFFVVVTALYFMLPLKGRLALLLAASCFFYMFFKPVYIFILFFTIIIDYFAGIFLEQTKDPRKKKRFLILSLVANVGILAIFKYYNFFNTNLRGLGEMLGYNIDIPYLTILLPIGLSFHTFQAMSYTIEVYRGNQNAERNFGVYALYVMFYPQLVAGPIERPQNILHQFYIKHPFSYRNAVDGLTYILWGMFKKVVIADRLSLLVDQVYNDPYQHTGAPLLVATILFAFQIFCDFSGYSDIAIGTAKFMGFNLMTNFDRPYSSRSVSEFWSRWHISLSSWFRDYVYIPLGGNRVSKSRWFFNLLFVFTLSGFWHGANWTFIVWGLLNGIYLVSETLLGNFLPLSYAKNKFIVPFKIAITFILISISWVFFRAASVDHAVYIISNMFSFSGGNYFSHVFGVFDRNVLLTSFALILFMELVHLLQGKYEFATFVRNKPSVFRWSFYYALICMIIFIGVFNNAKFIYFQF